MNFTNFELKKTFSKVFVNKSLCFVWFVQIAPLSQSIPKFALFSADVTGLKRPSTSNLGN
jgi:hypothetical protein